MSDLFLSKNQLSLLGWIDFSTVMALEAKGTMLLARIEHKKLIVDLSGVVGGDSALLALLLSWQRQADKKNIAIELRHWPAEVRRLAELCGLDKILR